VRRESLSTRAANGDTAGWLLSRVVSSELCPSRVGSYNRLRIRDQSRLGEMGTGCGCTDGSCGKAFQPCLCRVRSSSGAGAPRLPKVLGVVQISSVMNQCNSKPQISATQICTQCNPNMKVTHATYMMVVCFYVPMRLCAPTRQPTATWSRGSLPVWVQDRTSRPSGLYREVGLPIHASSLVDGEAPGLRVFARTLTRGSCGRHMLGVLLFSRLVLHPHQQHRHAGRLGYVPRDTSDQHMP
jgi:hypothetical protein